MATGQTIKDVRQFSQEIIQEFGLALQDLRMSPINQWFGALTLERSFSQVEAKVPYIQPSTVPTWGEIGRGIQTGDVKVEYADVVLQEISDSLTLKKNDFADPNQRQMLMNAVATKAGMLENRLWYRLCQILEEGDTSAWVVQDGQNFFSNSHSFFGQSYDNLLSGNLDPNNVTPYEEATTTLRNIPWTNGEYLQTDAMQLYLVVPEALRYRAKELIANAQIFRTNIVTENTYQDEAEIIVTPALTNPYDWYVLGTMGNLKPFLHARHTDFGDWQVIDKIDPRDENVFQRAQYEWFFQAQRAVVPIGYPFAIKVKGTS